MRCRALLAAGAGAAVCVMLSYRKKALALVKTAWARQVQQRASSTLDPAEWDTLRREAHALLDTSLAHLASVAAGNGRVWNPVPPAMKQELEQELPARGVPVDEVRGRLQSLLPYGVGNTHPRFFGWVHGSGNAAGVLPEIVGAAMNANCGGREHATIYVEKQVLAWCRAMMRFPADAGALLVSGTSMATVIALKAARDQRCGFASRASGVPVGLVGYASEQSHSCIKRAFDLLGLGTQALRRVPCDEGFRMDVEALHLLVRDDTRAGLTPFLVVGTAGSVNVGSIDNLDALADFAEAHGLWYHIDGAFGAAAMLSSAIAPRLVGLERASSLAFDFHKWLHVNYDAGCVLVRNGRAHLEAFSERPDYLASNTRGIAAGNPWPVDFGPELSRGYRALKVWALFLEHGTEKLGAAIAANCEQAARLAALVDAAPQLQRLAPVALQIVVFRYCPPHGASADLDALNDTIVIELQERGIAAPSTTRIRGELAIRINLTNHRTRLADLDLLVAEVQRIGARLCGSD